MYMPYFHLSHKDIHLYDETLVKIYGDENFGEKTIYLVII